MIRPSSGLRHNESLQVIVMADIERISTLQHMLGEFLCRCCVRMEEP
jgi:hypothetical protein